MKVKCTKVYLGYPKRSQTLNHHLILGKEYHVLEVEINPNKEIFYRIRSDLNGVPILFAASQFQVIKGNLAVNWEVTEHINGFIIFGPKSWQTEDFWEKYQEKNVKTLGLYQQELRVILREK